MAIYKEKNDKDLEKELVEKKNELRNFRFGVAGSKVRDVKTGKNLKKDIARILTEKNERKAEANK
jgi:ribosomal protein L29